MGVLRVVKVGQKVRSDVEVDYVLHCHLVFQQLLAQEDDSLVDLESIVNRLYI